MGRPKGIPKTGGRKPGTINRSTDELRTMVQNFISENIETVQNDFDKLEPKERLSFMERMLKMVLPAPLQELERLTDEQLDILIEKLKEQNNERKTA